MSSEPTTTAPASVVKFLDRNPPSLSVDEVREIAKRHYKLLGDFHPLQSERDQNFLVESNDGDRFVIKIANKDETVNVIDFQIGALRHIARTDPTLPVPRIVQSNDKLDFHTVRLASGDVHIVYVLTFLDGMLLSDAQDFNERAGMRRLGAFMARVDLALRGYFHPAARQQHPWNIETCTRLRHLSKHISAADDRSEVEDIFERMSEVVLPRLQTLRHQVVHQDAHTDNVLVDADDRTTITGLIDFGDLLFGTLVAEIAVACTSIPDGVADIVTPICDIVAGYDEVLPLEEDEVDLVFDLFCARNALTATVVAARAALTPGQAAHIESPRPFIDRLRDLKRIGRSEFSRRLRTACRFPAHCPATGENTLSADEEDGLVAARQSLMGKNATHFYRRPMHFERALGPWLYATDGYRYLDCYN
ncbi:MAG: phosphotransferase, partial [Woeseiaceae bacterium]|nr:phosphotransferase [Woeseiaceae bacterium]